MTVYFNSLDPACKSTVGAIERGKTLTLRLFFYGEQQNLPDAAELLLCKDGEEVLTFPMQKMQDFFEISLKFSKNGLYFYAFLVEGKRLSCGRLQEGTWGGEKMWQLTVYETGFQTPEWLKGGVIYQIFPDRFCRDKSVGFDDHGGRRVLKKWGDTPEFRPNEAGKVLNNDFFGGNFKGIQGKIEYLKSLGVTAIYLNPIFEAYSNHRYDTGDFFKFDELLGTVGDFQALVHAANSAGIELILDGVFNHVGADSVYFNRFGTYPSLGAYQSKKSPYFSWFHFIEYPNSYDCWWQIDTLPAVNKSDPKYRKFLFGKDGVLRYLLGLGVKGLRLDVVDELPDDFLKELRKTVKKTDQNAVLLGEVWEDASDKISYQKRREYFQGEELDGVMNYPLKDAIVGFAVTGNCEALRETLARLIDHYPKDALDVCMDLLSTHDTPRILTVLGGLNCDVDKETASKMRLTGTQRQLAENRLKIAATLQFTLPGVPCIYYGDENGMEGGKDPFCRACFDWEHLREDLVGFYRKLGEIRQKHRAVFAQGVYREIYADGGIFAFERKFEDKAVYVIVNHSSGKFYAELDKPFFEELSETNYASHFNIEPHTVAVLSEA